MTGTESLDEMAAVEARFRALVGEWDLGRSEVAALLGIDRDALGLDLVPRVQDGVAEARLRLLVEIRSMLGWVVRDVRDVPLWLREDGAEPGGDGLGEPWPTPLAFLSGPIGNLRAFRTVLRARAG